MFVDQPDKFRKHFSKFYCNAFFDCWNLTFSLLRNE